MESRIYIRIGDRVFNVDESMNKLDVCAPMPHVSEPLDLTPYAVQRDKYTICDAAGHVAKSFPLPFLASNHISMQTNTTSYSPF